FQTIASVRLGYAVILASVVLVAVPCSAGTMSFSVYTDYAQGSSNMKLYMYATTADQSTGCTHSNYTITANIYSPTNRHVASQSAGLQGSTSIDVLEDTGTYSLVTTGTYTCSCMKLSNDALRWTYYKRQHRSRLWAVP